MKPAETSELVKFARSEADRIMSADRDVGAVAPGAEFLRRYAGPDSEFYKATEMILAQVKAAPQSMAASTSKGAMANLLRSWADFVETGLATAPPFALAARAEVAGDLVDQAAELLGETDFLPAAAVMLAAAGLEELLRGLSSTISVAIAGIPSIVSYGEALKKTGVLDKGDVKELIALADVRNDAAHGNFALVTEERARVFTDRVRLFLAKHAP